MKHTGGPAFPYDRGFDSGMTLRDWFAGQILPQIWSELMKPNDEPITLPEMAWEAYRMADAMLAERQKED